MKIPCGATLSSTIYCGSMRVEEYGCVTTLCDKCHEERRLIRKESARLESLEYHRKESIMFWVQVFVVTLILVAGYIYFL